MREAGVSDEALLAGVTVGDEKACAAFVRRYQRRVYGLALSMVGDPVLAQDIAQEAFLRVWRHAPVFDRRRASVGTWVLTITRNLAVDALRVRKPVLAAPGELLWSNLADPGRSPADLAEGSDTRARIATALASLPPEQSRALVLAAVYGYTAAEVSKVEEVPLGTAKTRIRRGLRKLRALTSSQDLGGGQDPGEGQDLGGGQGRGEGKGFGGKKGPGGKGPGGDKDFGGALP
jgi:RNA polymerase sigma-70 factor (ECF subfamily)